MADEKDASVRRLLERLALDERGWIVVDHWEADRFAVGVASKGNPRRLVYISTFRRDAERFDYECETPAGPREEDYEVAASGEDVSLEQLQVIVAHHLNRRD